MGKHNEGQRVRMDTLDRRRAIRRKRHILMCVHVVGEFVLGSATIVAMEWTKASETIVHHMSGLH